MKTDIIKNSIKKLHKLLLITKSVAIIEYNGDNIDGCKAIYEYLIDNNISVDVVTDIVLFGKKNADIRHNKIEVQSRFRFANIITPGKDWRSVDVNSLEFNCSLVLHMMQGSDIIAKDKRISTKDGEYVSRIVLKTRKVFTDFFFMSKSSTDNELKLCVTGFNTLQDFTFAEDSAIKEKTNYCLEKEQYLKMYVENVSVKDVFFHTVDEVENGCSICNQCNNYGVRKQCPFAQLEVAKCYRDGIFVPKDDTIAHQWELMAARQGYKPAKLQVADDLKNGVGCDKNIYKALQIYEEYAHLKGNEECADEIIDLVDNYETLNKLIMVPHLARKANSGDNDAIYKISEAYKNGDLGLPKDFEQQKYWFEKGAESGDTRFYLSLAKMYEEKENWESAIFWYQKLNEIEIFEDYTDKIIEIEEKFLQLFTLSAQEIADKGFAFLNGYNVRENMHYAYLCFKKASEESNGDGERGLAICYTYGFEVDVDKDFAYEYNVLAAQHGNLRAMMDLYDLFTESEDVHMNEKAEEILIKFNLELNRQIINSSLSGLRMAGQCYTEGIMSYSVDEKKGFDYFEKAAKLGDLESMKLLAKCYIKGIGTNQDKKLAFYWFSKAAEMNDKYALFCVGHSYYIGEGVQRDTVKAFNYFSKSAERNYAAAKYYLGICYISGRGTNKDQEKGYKLIEDAANENCKNAMSKLCEEYFNGKYFKKDYEKSRLWGEKALSEGEKNVRFEVAYSSKETGHIDRAIELYTELAEEGNIAAMNNLGCIETDSSKSAVWFTKAADRGDVVAQCNIARYYKNGTGVEQDYEKALDYFKKSANKGYACSMYELALFYRYGYGVEENVEEMVSWYEKAVEKGYKKAMLELANCYKDGDILENDYSKAMEYYMKAVEFDEIDNSTSNNDEKMAIYNIGYLYENGYGVDKNISKAIYWYRKSANKNYAPAKDALIRLDTNWVDENGHATNGTENYNTNDDFPF